MTYQTRARTPPRIIVSTLRAIGTAMIQVTIYLPQAHGMPLSTSASPSISRTLTVRCARV
jgi:hypothetical protein